MARTSIPGTAGPLVILEKVTVGSGGEKWLDAIDLSISVGEQWAIVGPSGSGKTVLAHTLLGRHAHQGLVATGDKRIAIVEQQHRFKNLYGTGDLYYQQRFNSYDADQTMTVADELREYGVHADRAAPDARAAGGQGAAGWIDALHIRHLLTKPLIQLSNGENRRVQLAIALSCDPALLILDNPFLGLDVEGRSSFREMIGAVAKRGISILLITSSREIPHAITHVAELDKGKLVWSGSRGDFARRPTAIEPDGTHEVTATVGKRAAAMGTLGREAAMGTLVAAGDEDFSIAVKMVSVTIRYSDAIILRDVDWEVRKGERWGLTGPNGAGKSTLLSLITADNPQAYANKIWLFDRRRGTGESIWDIKRRIGFVSPELHLYFDYSATCLEVVASGLFDTIGLFRTLGAAEESLVSTWLERLSLTGVRNKRLVQLPAGQQRMALLARALIKNPSLLIFDEPCQGLDEHQTAHFTALIDGLCRVSARTLIYVSHYLDEIPSCVDRWLRIEAGRVLS